MIKPTGLLLLATMMGFPASHWPNSQPDTRDVPEWAKKAVWYQIFPERFRNGDPDNDPQLEDILGSWPHDSTGAYEVSNWTGDWYAYQPWEDAAKPLAFHLQRRRYGGDLQGVLDKLDYLQDLGINAIYFNPLFESPSLHKYDGASYHHIDNNFGPDPAGDATRISAETPDNPSTWVWTSADSLFLKLVRVCHQRGIRVIVDGVFNHVGLNFWAFRDVVEKQQDSRYAAWFEIKSWDNPATPDNEFDYAGWAGVRELPELREDENGIVSGPREYIFAAVRRWMDPDGDGDPSDGIDGWRLDVAEKVKKAFWRDFRTYVRSINSQAYLVGEVWWEDWQNNVMFNARPWLEGDIFDAVMNYRLARQVIHFFADRQNKITASQFDTRLLRLRNDYRTDVNYVLLNLMDSHDTDRLSSQIVNIDDDYDHRDNPFENSSYKLRKPTTAERSTQKIISIFQMTYIGAPMLYYGDEAGMWGADDPDCRKPMLWPDLRYDEEATDPLGRTRPKDANQFDTTLFDHYRKLIHTRTSHPALQTGDFATLLADNDKDCFAFKRFNSTGTLVIALNNSSIAQTIALPSSEIGNKTSWTDLLSEQLFEVRKGSLVLELPPKSGAILTSINQ